MASSTESRGLMSIVLTKFHGFSAFTRHLYDTHLRPESANGQASETGKSGSLQDLEDFDDDSDSVCLRWRGLNIIKFDFLKLMDSLFARHHYVNLSISKFKIYESHVSTSYIDLHLSPMGL